MIFLTGLGLLLAGLAIATFSAVGSANAYQKFDAGTMFCSICLCLLGIIVMCYSLLTFAYHNLP